jgi:toxin ParE1/3/4
MKSFVLSNAAKADLKDIAIFTEKRWGKQQRNHYIKKIDAVFDLLAESPLLGTSCDYIRKGYRKFPFKSHIIFYKMNESGHLEIIRILHKRMDT